MSTLSTSNIIQGTTLSNFHTSTPRVSVTAQTTQPLITEFKVGDVVGANGEDSSNTYTGRIVDIDENRKIVYVCINSNEPHWGCSIMGKNLIATAAGLWDGHSFLTKINDKPSLHPNPSFETIDLPSKILDLNYSLAELKENIREI